MLASTDIMKAFTQAAVAGDVRTTYDSSYIDAFDSSRFMETFGLEPYIDTEPDPCHWCRSRAADDARGNCGACGGPR